MARSLPSSLRRSLRACTAEGAAAEVVGACCGGAALTGWALHLGMSARLVGLVGALPVVTQMLQLGGAFVTARFGHRRTAIVCVALSRQTFLPLAFLPLLRLDPGQSQLLLLGVAGAHHGLGVLANNAWNAWMGELVPGGLRGRYFGRRTSLCTVVGGACALGAGLAMDHGARNANAGPVLQVLAVVASVAGVLSVVLMARQHARPARREPARWALHAMRRVFADGGARRMMAFSLAWNGACGLSAPVFALFLLRDLGTGYAVLAAQGAGAALAKVASGSAWGRTVDRVGPRRVLVVCTGGLVFSPLFWLACRPGLLWPLAADLAIGGALWGGHQVASFALPLSVAPPRERPFYVAAVALAGGAAFAVTSAFGGVLVERLPDGYALRVVIAGSAALRLLALVAALSLPRSTVAARPAAPARLEPSGGERAAA